MKKTKTILNSCGEKLFIETYTPEQYDSCIVFCHGITGCRKGRTMADNYFQDLAERLMNQNKKVVLFDFSGHGESEGADCDVTLSKSTTELEMVFNSEVGVGISVSFLAFSYGATVLCNFLSKHTNVIPQHIMLYSPCLFPNESCFLNVDSIFGKDIVTSWISGDIKRQGYALVGAKGFKFGVNMLDECNGFMPHRFEELNDRIMVLSGENDVILNTKYNKIFCEKNSISNVYLPASHSLFEMIGDVFKLSIEFLTK